MRYQNTKTIICCLYLLIISIHAVAAQKYAILIGINEYLPANTNPGPRHITNLKSPVNDVKMMENLLEHHFGFNPKNIMILTNSTATRANIFDSISLLQSILEPGDMLFFYYSGHGSQIQNTASTELDKMDETIVPADAYKGVPDIRDKEIGNIFNLILSKNIRLTAMFDCCHSGSNTRAITDEEQKKILPADASVNDNRQIPAPEDNGALIFSAAQDYETAAGNFDKTANCYFSYFTRSFVDAINSSQEKLAANDLFLKTRAIMASHGFSQEPVIAGSDAVKYAEIFGAGNISKQEYYVINKNITKKTLRLQAGTADGIGTGDILLEPVTKTKVKVTTIRGVSECEATCVEGSIEKLVPGSTFILFKKAAVISDLLSIYIPKGCNDIVRQQEAVNAIQYLKSKKLFTAFPANHTLSLSFENNTWVLSDSIGNTNIGNSINTPILESITQKKIPCYVSVPIHDSIIQKLKGSINETFKGQYLSDTRENANYELCSSSDGIDVNIFMHSLSHTKDPAQAFSPAKTNAIPLNNIYTDALIEQIRQLAKLFNWMSLRSPSNDKNFPFHLGIFNKDGTELKKEYLYQGDTYDIKLVPDSLNMQKWDKKARWIYVFYMDHYTGEIDLLYPKGSANVENHLPYNSDETIPSVGIPLTSINVDPPFGTVSIYYLYSSTPIPNPNIIKAHAVNTRSVEDNPLENLLKDCTFATRSVGNDIPIDWGLQKMIRFTAKK